MVPGAELQWLERETGIEPALVAWKATVLPLNYSRAAWNLVLALWDFRKLVPTSALELVEGGG